MYGLTRARIPGGLALVIAISTLAGDPSAVLAQKKNKKNKPAAAPLVAADPTKRPAPAPAVPPGQRLSADGLARHIDTMISKRLAEDKITPSPRCSDEEFVRRVYLDLTGKVPTAEQTVRFLDGKESNKRSLLIDELLAGKEYGRHQADLWQALLLPRNSDNRRLMQWYRHLVTWMEERFNSNTPWNNTVKELLTASGPVEQTGPVIYWLANATADKVTDNVSRMFLGLQLECAQCHNHPFTDFKQNDYWGMAAFFTKVSPDGNAKGAAKKGGSVGIAERARVPNKRRLPDSAKLVPAKFLQGEQPTIKANEPARPVLADWLTTANNPYFARAMANRAWYQLFGRGFVMPVDDMHEANAASHPELLADLGKQFAANGFDLKYLFRAICNSETYQRSSKLHGNNRDAGPELFARMALKPLSPEQMFDSLQVVLGAERRDPAGRNRPARLAPNAREAFVTFFLNDDGGDPTEYQTGIPQVLRLMNSPQMNNAAALAGLVRASKDSGEALEKLYLTVLARRPTAEEATRVAEYLRKNSGEPRTALAGVLWALVNSSEFALNR